MERAYRYGKTGLGMKETGEKERHMEEEHFIMLTEMSMRENFKRTELTGQALTITRMALSMLEIGRMI